MPRTWGYIVVAIAVLVGVAALLLPMPESVEVARIEAPEPQRERPVPARPQRPKPAPPKAKKPPTPPPAVAKPFPMQDTTKARQMITPPKKPNG